MMISDRRKNSTSNNNINNRSCRRSMRHRRRSYVTNAKNYLACDPLPSPQHDTAHTSSWKSSLRLSRSPWAPPRRSPSSSTVGRHTDGGPRLNKTDLIPQRTNFRQKKTTSHWRENEQFQFACSRFLRSLLLETGVFVCALVFVCATMHARSANGVCRRHGGCGSSKGFETTRGAAAWRIKTVGCLDENVVRTLDERRERLLSENDWFFKHKHEMMFFFHPTEISPNHLTIQQLFIPSIIYSSNYPTTFHPIYYFLIQLSNNFSSHLVFLHPAIQQLFFPSIISSSNYPAVFHPIYYFLIQLSNNFSSHYMFPSN